MPFSNPNPGPHAAPDVPYTPTAPPASPGPKADAFGLGIPVNDWEAALLLYGIGLFVVDTEMGTVYLLGAWAVAMLMFISQVGKSQPERRSLLLPHFGL